MYNSFKVNSKNNKVPFDEYIKIKAPYERFLKINEKHLPNFLNYDLASASEIRYLCSAIRPTFPNEEHKLTRREGEDSSFWNYIYPKPLLKLLNKKEDYIIVFKSFDFTEVSNISKLVKNKKVYKWGTSEKKGYDIYYTFSKVALGYISKDNILMEFGDNSKYGLKNGNIPKKGMLEYNLNYFVLIKEKLQNKYLEAEYFLNGEVFPLKRNYFI